MTTIASLEAQIEAHYEQSIRSEMRPGKTLARPLIFCASPQTQEKIMTIATGIDMTIATEIES